RSRKALFGSTGIHAILQGKCLYNRIPGGAPGHYQKVYAGIRGKDQSRNKAFFMTQTEFKKIIDDLPLAYLLNNEDELFFLLSHIKPEHRVLEYGSGGSSVAISRIAGELHTIEHDEMWYKKVKAHLPAHAHIYHIPRNS